MASEPKRPATVPAEARWNAGNNEWELGEHDAEGKCVGEWRYWLAPDGHLVCLATFSDSGDLAEYERYHPNGEPSQRGRLDKGKWIEQCWMRSSAPTTEKWEAWGQPDNCWMARKIVGSIPLEFEYFDKEEHQLSAAGNRLDSMDQRDTSKFDSLFEPGPVGFLDDSSGPSRLRQFVCAVNPDIPLETPESAETASDAPTESAEEPESEDPEFTGADAWKAEAMRKWRGLWSGDASSIHPVFGVDAPAQLLAFERATQGANPWSTFVELRLDAAIMAEPPEDENLFEKCVLNDQLNYLGTALPEVFSGLVGIGTLGNGDSYHLELDPPEEQTHVVYFYDHEEHCFDWAFSVDLESLAFLAALCRAVDDELVSKTVSNSGFRALRGKVAPSWHFSIEERDEDFEGWEQEEGKAMPLFLFWRAYWLYGLFRQDGISGIEDLRSSFAENLNTVLPPEQLPGRLEIASRSVPTALYSTWRAYLFDEPELSQYLEVCRAHPARIARDAAKLIDELREGRESLGRIAGWPRLLERFRELDLDPRRAAERDVEVQAQKAALEEERTALREELASLEGEAELNFVAERISRPELHGAMLHTLLKRPSRVEANRGMEYLLNQEYSRDNRLYRHEEHEACGYVAKHADPVLSLLMLGMTMYRGESGEEELLPAPADAERMVIGAPEKLPEPGRQALRDALAALDLEDRPGWRESTLVKIAGKLRDPATAPTLRGLLARLPSEGGFETSLHFDDFIGAIAISLREIGDVEATSALAPFATSPTLRMRNARIESALTIATVAPDAFTDEMAERALEFMAQINDGQENGKALLALAKGKPGFAGAKDAKPMAKSYPQVRFAKALAQGNEAEAKSELEAIFTERAYDQKGTIKRRRFGLLVHEIFGLLPGLEILEATAGLDPDLDGELARLGGFDVPPRITWFDVEQMDSAELQKVLQDPKVSGRAHAARRVRGDADCRKALEAAIQTVLERPFDDDARYLLEESVMSLVALPESDSTVALCDLLLRHENRDFKDPVLRHLPAWSNLKGGMEFVCDEKWGWQESAANKWLEEHG